MKTLDASGPILFCCEIQGDKITAKVVKFETFEFTLAEFDETTFRIFDSTRPEVLAIADMVAQAGGEDGAWMIARERRRQIDEEKWTSENDDDHKDAEMLQASGAYARVAEAQIRTGSDFTPGMDRLWPWSLGWWKPSKDPVRNLIKAGALIAAEIDRLVRARGPWTPPEN